MPNASSISEVLGGRKALKRRIATLADLRDTVRAGLPYASLEAVMGKFALARTEAAAAIDLPQRTIARRKKERRLRAGESDRLFRLARIAAQAAAVLGSEENAGRWLHRPNRALGNYTPLELLDSDIGARQIEALLGRIEHGLLS